MRFSGFVPLAVLLGAPPGQAQGPANAPTFRARTELVVVDVAVTDPEGKPVPGLKREDFRVLEDGKSQDIATFEAVEIADVAVSAGPAESGGPSVPSDPPTMAILFDDLHLRPFDAERLKTAVRDLLRAEAGQGTQVALIAPGAGVARMGRLPEAERDLENVLRGLKGFVSPMRQDMSEQEAYEINALRNEGVEILVAERLAQKGLGGIEVAATRAEVRGRAAEMDREWSLHRQSTLEALAQTLGWLASTKGRRTLVLVSRGFVYDSDLHGYRQAIGASRRANVPIHLLDARGLEGLLPFQDLDVQEASLPRPGISTQ
ncbi:MAG TPA: VWA domain-containing protein, partial [Vicinamibacteria bacterium]|nr:VWA domain-containing protein [Vicinamibacteria bacterium]